MRLTTVATPVSMKSKRLRAVDVALIGVACRGGGTLSERRESAEKVRNGTAGACIIASVTSGAIYKRRDWEEPNAAALDVHL